MGLGLHHQVKHFDSQMLIMREVTCAQCVLDDPATAAAEIARVLTAARHLSRPVYIEFPRDMVDRTWTRCRPSNRRSKTWQQQRKQPAKS